METRKENIKQLDKKVFVNIYCKIYTENFSEKMLDKTVTGLEIYEFLMQDAGCCFDEADNLILGDCNLWYLGSNEKFGHMRIDDKEWGWSYGGSSFNNVESFTATLYHEDLISKLQFHTLMNKCGEGRLIGSMYNIRDYLIKGY